MEKSGKNGRKCPKTAEFTESLQKILWIYDVWVAWFWFVQLAQM